MQLKFKKLHEDAVLPTYAKPGDAGLDITATSNGTMVDSQPNPSVWYYIEYKTGLSVEIPEGYVGLLFPRSSISKSSLILANAVGVVDSSYRGEICFRFKIDSGVINQASNTIYIGDEKASAARYKKGDRIGQLVILPYPTIEPEFADELSETERGTGGFGSSDIKVGETL